jgi:hypothetical protein
VQRARRQQTRQGHAEAQDRTESATCHCSSIESLGSL